MKPSHPRSPADVVAAAIAAVNAHDPEALRQVSRRDFVAFPASPFLGGDGRPYSGREGLARWIENLEARWASYDLRVDDLLERGDRVFCRVIMAVTPKQISAPITHEMYLVLDTRRGQLAGVRSYGGDRSAAVAAFNRL